MSYQRPYYDIDLQIDKKSYALNVQSVSIISSIFGVFQTVIVRIRIDSQDVVTKKLYGQHQTSILIRELTEDIQDRENHEIDLYVLKVLGGNTQKPQDQQMHMLSNNITLICVPKKPWEYMTKAVNYLAQNTSPKSPYEVANTIVDKYLSGVKKEISDKNANKYKGEQLPVPPMNFAAAIDYLEERYGIYKGPLFYQCRFEQNTFSMWDLGQKIKDPEVYTIYTLAHGKKEAEDVYKKSGADDKTFYTYSNIKFKTRGGESVGGNRYEHRFLLKPRDKLYQIKTVNVDDIFKNHLPKDGSGKLLFNEDLKKNNVAYHARGFVGVDTDDSVITSQLSKKFFIQSEAQLRMDRNLRFKNLFKVGIPIMLTAEAQNYEEYHGKYLVKGTAVTLMKDNTANFKAIADVHLFRSNVLT